MLPPSAFSSRILESKFEATRYIFARRQSCCPDPNLFFRVFSFPLTLQDIRLILHLDMGKQTSIDYFQMFSGLIQRLQNLTKHREDVDIGIAKLKELIVATFP